MRQSAVRVNITVQRVNITSALCARSVRGALDGSRHKWNMFLFIISMRLLVTSMKSSPPWRQTRSQDPLACRGSAPSLGELRIIYVFTDTWPDVVKFFHWLFKKKNKSKTLPDLSCPVLGVGLFRVWSSGWRWRPLSGCCGECVRVTPSSATQKWTKTWPILTL